MKKTILLLAIISQIIVLTGCSKQNGLATSSQNTDSNEQASIYTINIDEIADTQEYTSTYTTGIGDIADTNEQVSTNAIITDDFTDMLFEDVDYSFHELSKEEFSSYKNSFLQVVCVDATVIALMSDGNVITWGNTYYGKTGNGKMSSRIPGETSEPANPSLIDFERDIIKVGASKFMAFAITDLNEVYMWGYNCFGQTGSFPDRFLKPKKIVLPEKIVNVAAEDAATLFLTDNGQVLFSGIDISQYNDLSTRNENIAFEYDPMICDEPYPLTVAQTGYTKFELPFNCIDISVSIMNYSFLSENGEVYMKGTLIGDYERKERNIIHNELFLIDFPEKISAIESGSNFIMALSESGNVYLYGNKSSVFFDEGSDIEVSGNIYKKGNLNDIVSISCDMYCVAAVDKYGHAWGFGIDNEGSINESKIDDYQIVNTPIKYKYDDVKECISEISNSTFILNNGTIVIIGNDNCGQISKIITN